MRHTMLTMFGAAVVALFAWTTPAQAQLQSTIDANVPFPFVVVNTTLPAGHYIVDQADSSEPGVWTLSNAAGTIHVDFFTEGAAEPAATRGTDLIFDQLGGKDFLAQVLLPGDQGGLAVEHGRAEEKLLRTEKPVRRAVTCAPARAPMNHHA